MPVLDDGLLQQIHAGGNGENMVDKHKVELFEIRAVSVYLLLLKSLTVGGVNAESLEQAFERGFVNVSVEKENRAVVDWVSGDGDVVLVVG